MSGRGSVAEVVDVLLLQIMNRIEPQVAHPVEAGGHHPEDLFRFFLGVPLADGAVARAFRMQPRAMTAFSGRGVSVLVGEDGGQAPIDTALRPLGELYTYIVQTQQAGADPKRAIDDFMSTFPKATALEAQLQSMARAQPEPNRRWLTGVANTVTASAVAPKQAEAARRVEDVWRKSVAPTCQEALDGRYPFVPGSTTDVNLIDFARVLGPNGLIEQFSKSYIEPFADTSVLPWRSIDAKAGGLRMSASSLAVFERAARIRQAFFSTEHRSRRPFSRSSRSVSTIGRDKSSWNRQSVSRLSARPAALHATAMAATRRIVGERPLYARRRSEYQCGLTRGGPWRCSAYRRRADDQDRGSGSLPPVLGHRRLRGGVRSAGRELDQPALSSRAAAVPLSGYVVMAATTDPAPGLFGKLPMRGDFVSRRLPARFVEAWDDWLGVASLAAAMSAEDWLPLYLAGPLWRFAPPPNLLSEHSVAGVLMPSVDAVNRHFPLTVAATAPPALGPFVLAAEADAWFAAAEAVALSCLDPDATMSSVERSLAALGSLRACGEPGARPEPLTPPVGAKLRWRLAGDLSQSVRASCPGILDAVAAATYGPFSLWWTSGSNDVEPVLLVFSGLPCPEAFFGLVRGQDDRQHRRGVIFPPGTAPCLWAGDSRIYRLRGGRLERLTRDHSRTEELIAQGRLDPARAKRHPLSNVITRAVGAQADLVVERRIEPLRISDRFLLCSDGLYRTVTDDELADILPSGDCGTPLKSSWRFR